MNKRDLPACSSCGARRWQLEGELQILFYGDADDPAGPFKRESAVDSRMELHFWCRACGDEPAPRDERALADLYRSYDPARAFDPRQGGLLELAFLGRQGTIVTAPPPRIVRRGLTPLRLRRRRDVRTDTPT